MTRALPPAPAMTAPLPSTVLLVIPVYNHGATLRDVAQRALAAHPHVLVVDDGSDEPVQPNLADLPLTCIRISPNGGKGAAIVHAATWAKDAGFTHILTLDADGQHNPADVGRFAPALGRNPGAIIVGARDFTVPNVPASSRFGRSFSGFWMQVQTGVRVSDMQSGFRLYPVAVLLSVPCGEKGFAFEVEIMVRAAWAGFAIEEVPVPVWYPPRDQRVSHFRAWHDNVRLSLLNTRLTTRAMLPMPHRRLRLEQDGGVSLVRPLESLRTLLATQETPRNLALSAAMGMFLGALPIPGLQVISIMLLCGYFRLNKYCALAVNQLGLFPLVPAMAVEMGHYCLRGVWLTEFSWQTLGREAPQRLLEWVVGSLLTAPLLAMVLGLFVFVLSHALRAGMRGVRKSKGKPLP